MYVIRRARSRDPERLQQEMEAVFRTLMPGGPAVAGGQPSPWRPATEVYETREALVVRAEIAGMDEGQLSVDIDGDMLVIRGERPDRCPDGRRSYHEARIPYGAFRADIYIPFPVDADQTVAEYENGFLRIVLPRGVARTIVPRQVGAASVDRQGAQ
ncbi:MAG: Hsp20/alpha crystallin family protein [Chloroflexota bacterium]|nr:Hsp20/alpha crystallin family protein [Chloroflexota bacterium]